MREGRASVTARWVATQRGALHSTRPARGDAAAEQRLYQDLSLRILGTSFGRPAGMDLRTKFVDDRLLEAIDDGVAQVVLVGAGYDGRPLRFSEAPVKWIEVDHPATQEDKLRRLRRVAAPIGHVAFVGADLLSDSLTAKLDEVGHDPKRRTFWLCEGLFPYLSARAVRDLCSTLRSLSSRGSVMVCNVLIRGNPSVISRMLRMGVDGLLAALGERRLCEFGGGDVKRFLGDAGWKVDISEATSPSRPDGSYLLAVAASPLL